MNILKSYQKMFGGGGQQMQPSGEMNFGGGGGFPSFDQLRQASMGLADAASRRSMIEAALQSSLRKSEAGYGSQLRKGEMGLEYDLRGKLAGIESGLRQGEIGSEYALRGSLARREAGIAARQQGFSGLSGLQRNIRRQRMQSS